MKFLLALILAFFFTYLCSAAPIEKRSNHGDATWYYPGLGACGYTNSDTDLVIAVAPGHFAARNQCNRPVAISYGNKRVNVKVVDRCAGCGPQDIDLSPTAFAVLAALGVGRMQVVWDFTTP
ncbi:hypothetical protein RUND412_001583 [Rhizina undulata]